MTGNARPDMEIFEVGFWLGNCRSERCENLASSKTLKGGKTEMAGSVVQTEVIFDQVRARGYLTGEATWGHYS